MNRILFFNSLQVLAGLILIIIYRATGYTMAALFSQPSQYFLLLLPIVIIFGLFSATITIFYKANWKCEHAFKYIALALTIFISIYTALSPWIYIVCGSKLQVLLISLIFSLFIIEVGFFAYLKMMMKMSKRGTSVL